MKTPIEKEVHFMELTVYGIEKIKIGFDPESDVDIVLW